MTRVRGSRKQELAVENSEELAAVPPIQRAGLYAASVMAARPVSASLGVWSSHAFSQSVSRASQRFPAAALPRRQPPSAHSQARALTCSAPSRNADPSKNPDEDSKAEDTAAAKSDDPPAPKTEDPAASKTNDHFASKTDDPPASEADDLPASKTDDLPAWKSNDSPT
ncbi:hypothetical protein IMZ48_15845, partial [Candidatus Bathyarchaeota archaeon]|nr:hypothetical protein [Candidatus Bathyarchaeota archaeon]